ncbi:hypothetical protein PR048_032112 [Dryococelus australis]|uniref:Uncharacterized protein n=1 Tax=Dryococelus australis TaxID=614101 RepID=A0ABQ9G1B7_9NEOP|nr:hypothetical protein PR048_032112 [Dryococelus australis]
MPMSTVHWLSAVTEEGDDWTSLIQEVPNTVWTNVQIPAKFALSFGIRLNFTVLYILELASFLHWLLYRCGVTHFLTGLHIIEGTRLGSVHLLAQKLPRACHKVLSNDKRIAKGCVNVGYTRRRRNIGEHHVYCTVCVAAVYVKADHHVEARSIAKRLQTAACGSSPGHQLGFINVALITATRRAASRGSLIRQHRHGSHVIRVQTVNTCQKPIPEFHVFAIGAESSWACRTRWGPIADVKLTYGTDFISNIVTNFTGLMSLSAPVETYAGRDSDYFLRLRQGLKIIDRLPPPPPPPILSAATVDCARRVDQPGCLHLLCNTYLTPRKSPCVGKEMMSDAGVSITYVWLGHKFVHHCQCLAKPLESTPRRQEALPASGLYVGALRGGPHDVTSRERRSQRRSFENADADRIALAIASPWTRRPDLLVGTPAGCSSDMSPTAPFTGSMAPFTLLTPPHVLVLEMSSYWFPLCTEGAEFPSSLLVFRRNFTRKVLAHEIFEVSRYVGMFVVLLTTARGSCYFPMAPQWRIMHSTHVPPRRTGFDNNWGRSRIFARGIVPDDAASWNDDFLVAHSAKEIYEYTRQCSFPKPEVVGDTLTFRILYVRGSVRFMCSTFQPRVLNAETDMRLRLGYKRPVLGKVETREGCNPGMGAVSLATPETPPPLTSLFKDCLEVRCNGGPPLYTERTGFNPRISASGNRAGRFRWSAGFLRDLPFPQPLHSRSQELVVKSRPNLSTQLHTTSMLLVLTTTGTVGSRRATTAILFPAAILFPITHCHTYSTGSTTILSAILFPITQIRLTLVDFAQSRHLVSPTLDSGHESAKYFYSREVMKCPTVRKKGYECLEIFEMLSCGRMIKVKWTGRMENEKVYKRLGEERKTDKRNKKRINVLFKERRLACVWGGARMRRRGKREIPEKTRRPTASSGTIPTCESPVTRPGIEPGSPWGEKGGAKSPGVIPLPLASSPLPGGGGTNEAWRQVRVPPGCEEEGSETLGEEREGRTHQTSRRMKRSYEDVKKSIQSERKKV